MTSWSLFQTLVFDVAERAPVEIASVISAPMRAHSLAADPIVTALAIPFGGATGVILIQQLLPVLLV